MKRLIPLAIITAICLAIAGYVIRVYEDSRPLADSITFDSVRPWQSEDGTFYVFLPSFADTNNLSVENKTRKKITIDGGAVGTTLKIDLNEKHDIVFGKQREHIV
ncbi:MAG: hypothetical protein J6332_06600, partial [Abditibacteriota bacterium]|nr:hypothetical protein [Abditibacteriota bacterium]